MKGHLAQFSEEMAGGGNPFCLKFWVKLTLLEQNDRFLVSSRL